VEEDQRYPSCHLLTRLKESVEKLIHFTGEWARLSAYRNNWDQPRTVSTGQGEWHTT